MGFLTIKPFIMKLAKRGKKIFPQLYILPRNKKSKSFFHGLTENKNTIENWVFYKSLHFQQKAISTALLESTENTTLAQAWWKLMLV